MILNKFKLSASTSMFTLAIIVILLSFVLTLVYFFNIVVISLLTFVGWSGLFMSVFLFFLLLMIYGKKKYKALFFNISVLFLTLGCYDTAKLIWPNENIADKIKNIFKPKENNVPIVQEKTTSDTTQPVNFFVDYSKEAKVYYIPKEGYFSNSEILGYGPSKNNRVRTYSTYNDTKLFDVHYTIDKDGLRISPPFNAQKDSKSILFFGCSITFGYGLEDNQALPYQVGVKSDYKYKIYNFAFNGYGTHQMVSELEHNLVDSIVKVPPKYAFYISIPDHMKRMMHEREWDDHGPKYVLDDNGEAIFKGHFDDLSFSLPKEWGEKVKAITNKSAIVKSIILSDKNDKGFTEYHVNLYTAMIKKANALVKKKYPGCEFHFIYNGDVTTGVDYKVLFEKLEADGIFCHFNQDIIPDISNMVKYTIKYPYENHPNALTNEKYAQYIIDNIIYRDKKISLNSQKN